MSQESLQPQGNLTIKEIRENNAIQRNRYESDFIHPKGYRRADMIHLQDSTPLSEVLSDELTPLIDISEDRMFTGLIMGRLSESRLPLQVDNPIELTEQILAMRADSQYWDQWGSNVITSSDEGDLETLCVSRSFGYYDEEQGNYHPGPIIYIPERKTRCYIKSHPLGLQMPTYPELGVSDEEVKASIEAVSIQDVMKLALATGSPADDYLESVIAIGDNIAILVARTKESLPRVDGNNQKETKRLLDFLEETLAIGLDDPTREKNIKNLRELEAIFGFAIYNMYLADGKTDGIWYKLD